MASNLDEIVSHYDNVAAKAKFDKLERIEDDDSSSLDNEKKKEVHYFKEKLLQYVEHIVNR